MPDLHQQYSPSIILLVGSKVAEIIGVGLALFQGADAAAFLQQFA
jgi:hypothetical protein